MLPWGHGGGAGQTKNKLTAVVRGDVGDNDAELMVFLEGAFMSHRNFSNEETMGLTVSLKARSGEMKVPEFHWNCRWLSAGKFLRSCFLLRPGSQRLVIGHHVSCSLVPSFVRCETSDVYIT